MNLTGKTALVTGSTSGIGLGIALKLAEAGADLILNGFGDASAALAEVGEHGRKVGHHGRTCPIRHRSPSCSLMPSATSAASTSWSTTPASSTWRRWRSFPSSAGTPSSPSTCPRHSTPHAWRCPACASAAGADHQYRLGARAGRLRAEGRLRRRQARAGRADQGRRAGNRHHADHLCHLPRLVLTPLVQQQIDERARRAATSSAPATTYWPRSSLRWTSSPHAAGCDGAVPLQRGRRSGTRRRVEHGRRLGRALNRSFADLRQRARAKRAACQAALR